VDTVREAGVDVFIAHARRAWLSGLSPRQNRDVPPLDHDWVYRLKQESPELTVIINGGVDSLDAVETHLEHVDGVMIGRAAYHSPWLLAQCQAALLGGGGPSDPVDLVPALTAYLESLVERGVPIKYATRHVLGLFQGRPGAKLWRRTLSENAFRDDRNAGILGNALAAMPGRKAA
jgi:tRNA-dihydrouridine synthase A